MLGELAGITDRRERVRFSIGLFPAMAQLLVRDWATSPRLWAASVACGAVIPFLDRHDGSACLLVRLLVLAALGLGLLAPRAPWRWALAVLAGLAGASPLSHLPGFFDRGDLAATWITMITSVYGAAFLRRALDRAAVERTA